MQAKKIYKQPRHKLTMRTTKSTVTKKCLIVKQAGRTVKIQDPAHLHNFYPSQIRKWRENYEKNEGSGRSITKKLAVHSGSVVQTLELEN